MNVQDYLNNREQIVEEATIQDDPYALFTSGGAGTLVCTNNRLVYVEGKDVIDLSINRVDSFEYRAPEMPKTYLYAGIGGLALAAVFLLSEPVYFPLTAVVGIVLLLVAYWLRTSTLKIHTSSGQHEFQSRNDDLMNIAHALRDREIASS